MTLRFCRQKFLGWAASRLDPRLVPHYRHARADARYAGSGFSGCWNNWRRCGLSKTVKRFCLPGGKCWQNVATDAVNLLREHFPNGGFPEAEGGLSYWIELPGMLATQLAARAETTGIIMGTGTRFGLIRRV